MDDQSQKNAIAKATRLMLRPIARLLIRSSVPFKDFVELAKEVFVDVAGEDYGIRGRETNSARVAILTGISRKDVGRIRKSARERTDDHDLGYVLPATRVLAGWHLDPAFCDGDGKPLPLYDSDEDGTPSITALLKRFAGDLPPRALIGELEQVSAIRRNEDDGRWYVLTRYYMPAQLDLNAIVRSGSVIEDLGNTINHNLFREQHESSRFEGRATRDAVVIARAEDFSKFVEERAAALLQESDGWLAQHDEQSSGASTRNTMRLGIGVYLIRDD
ncbi:MAG: DUF6502 family protein [Pseudomonadota bacterium]